MIAQFTAWLAVNLVDGVHMLLAKRWWPDREPLLDGIRVVICCWRNADGQIVSHCWMELEWLSRASSTTQEKGHLR